MALSEGSGIGNQDDQAVTRGGLFNIPEKYTTIDELLDVNKPDVRDELIKAYGDQGITGFLKLTGAVRSGGTADFVQWYEEGRRHTKLRASGYTHGTKTVVFDQVNGVGIASLPQVVQFGDEILNVGDVLMGLNTGDTFVVLTVSSSSDCSCTVDRMDGTAAGDGLIDANEELAIIGSTFAQGSTSDDITVSKDAEVRKLTNGYNIIKDMYQVAGSQATNIGYINVGGDYRWFMYGEQEARRRFEELVFPLLQAVAMKQQQRH